MMDLQRMFDQRERQNLKWSTLWRVQNWLQSAEWRVREANNLDVIGIFMSSYHEQQRSLWGK